MAERNLYLERLTPDNCAIVLIDQQTGTMLGVQDFRLDSFRRNVLTLAGAAKLHKLPTVLTGSYVEGPNGPIMSELLEMFPDAPTIYRPGPIRAWDDPNFVKAVEGLGRKKLIMAGVTIDVCLMFPVQQAIAAGFEVYAVYDASGCWDQLSELTSIMRLEQMGAIVCNSLAVVADLQSDWRKPTAPGTLALFKECNPFYDFLGSNQAANTKSA
jgi:nicotinamidase-related amidase